uniref:Dynein heavy chain C-terminal domain-containing protein n=1 Tax=Ditylum brightwellii TaxID=49249 RepID=A0A7S1ZPA3_9STRA
MRYLIGEANYGGRVTDNWDRRLLNVYMNQFFCENAISEEKFFLSELSDYFIPPDGDLGYYKEFIEHLPHNDHPAAFGQHPNADISSQIEQTNELLETIVSLQPGAITVDGSSPEEVVANQIDSMNGSIPELFDISSIQQSMRARPGPEALKTVLYQEVTRYNVLLSHIRKSLGNLRNAVTGFAAITPNLEEIMTALLEYKVPRSWSMAYPSTKPLGSWINDLQLRIRQIRLWIDYGIPNVFWLSGFTYPSGFLTAVLQTMSRAKGVAIDTLNWEFHVVEKSGDEITEGPKDGGVFVSGLYLEGARWDFSENQLAESLPMELMSQMPILHFKPVEGKKKINRNMYECPLYMYPVRTGTRERPSFVISVDLKSGNQTDDHWTKRGVALLLSSSE